MHDLTAERAAKLYDSLNAYIPTDRCVYASEVNQVEVEKAEDIVKLTAALKTARQEALREGMTLAAEEADMHVCDDPRFCHCSSRIYKAIMDRLASEGA